MSANIEEKIQHLLGALEKTRVGLEELLDEFSDREDRIVPKLESLSREQIEARSELQELREAIEELNQKIERIAALRS